MRGFSKRIELHRHLLAWTQRTIISPWVKRPPSIGQLLGRKSLMGMSPKQIKEHYAQKKVKHV